MHSALSGWAKSSVATWQTKVASKHPIHSMQIGNQVPGISARRGSDLRVLGAGKLLSRLRCFASILRQFMEYSRAGVGGCNFSVNLGTGTKSLAFAFHC